MDWIIREHTEIELHANSIKMEVGFPQSHESLSFTPCRNKKMLFWRARCNSVISLRSLLTASSGPPALECCSPFQDLIVWTCVPSLISFSLSQVPSGHYSHPPWPRTPNSPTYHACLLSWPTPTLKHYVSPKYQQPSIRLQDITSTIKRRLLREKLLYSNRTKW